MTRDEVKQAFKQGDGKIIAQTLRLYFAQKIAEGRVDVIKMYDPQEENKFGQNQENDIVSQAKLIFNT